MSHEQSGTFRKPTNVHFVTIVWGASYTDVYLRMAIPSLLTEGNLPDFDYQGTQENRYIIYTTSKDAQTISAHPSFKKLQEFVLCEFELIDDLKTQLDNDELDLYEVCTLCNRRAIEAAVDEESALVVLCPDQIFGQGCFRTMGEALKVGKQLVAGSIRTVRESTIEALSNRYYNSDNLSLDISCRELVKLSLECFHPAAAIHLWGDPTFDNNWPAFLYWSLGKKGVIQRGVHLHPFLTIPTKDSIPPAGTKLGIDGLDYIERVCPNFDDLYIPVDSDDFYYIGLTPEESPPLRDNTVNLARVAQWLDEYTCSHQRRFLDIPLCFHTGDLDSDWDELVASSQDDVNRIFETQRALDSYPELKCDVFQICEEHREELKRADHTRDKVVGPLYEKLYMAAELQNDLAEEMVDDGRTQDAIKLLMQTAEMTQNRHLRTIVQLVNLYAEIGSERLTLKMAREVLKIGADDPFAVQSCLVGLRKVGLTDVAHQVSYLMPNPV